MLAIAESFPKDATFEPYDRHYHALVLPLKRVARPIFDELEAEELGVRQVDPQLADEFARGWVDILEFFKERLNPSPDKDRQIEFVEQLRRDGYDRKLRAGQSLYMFTVSRSRRYGLRRDQPSLAFGFHEGVMHMVTIRWDGHSTSTLKPGMSTDVEAALADLLKHPID